MQASASPPPLRRSGALRCTPAHRLPSARSALRRAVSCFGSGGVWWLPVSGFRPCIHSLVSLEHLFLPPSCKCLCQAGGGGGAEAEICCATARAYAVVPPPRYGCGGCLCLTPAPSCIVCSSLCPSCPSPPLLAFWGRVAAAGRKRKFAAQQCARRQCDRQQRMGVVHACASLQAQLLPSTASWHPCCPHHLAWLSEVAVAAGAAAPLFYHRLCAAAYASKTARQV